MRALASIILLFAAGPVAANSNGAPWGAADQNGGQNCNSCHFDGEAVLESEAIGVDGIPALVEADEDYLLHIWLKDESAKQAGYLASVSAGAFLPDSGQAEVREKLKFVQISPRQLHESGHVCWQVMWKAPDKRVDTVDVQSFAVNAANNDGSPLGDIIHYKHTVFRIQD